MKSSVSLILENPKRRSNLSRLTLDEVDFEEYVSFLYYNFFFKLFT